MLKQFNFNGNMVSGLVERDGDFWVENLPLSGGCFPENRVAGKSLDE